MQLFNRNKKVRKEDSFSESNYSVLDYEQLLLVNGAGGSSRGPSGPTGPSSSQQQNTNSNSNTSYYDNNGNKSNNPNVINGRNMGESTAPSNAVSNLIKAQDSAMNNPIYQQGGGGPFNNGNPNSTWCNQATFEIARETSPSMAQAMYGNDYNGYNTNANKASQNLQKAASDTSNSINEISPDVAQNMANLGYTVIAARENSSGIGHITTVRPGYEYNSNSGTTLNNIGAAERTGINSSSVSFPGCGEVHYYVDTEQFCY